MCTWKLFEVISKLMSVTMYREYKQIETKYKYEKFVMI